MADVLTMKNVQMQLADSSGTKSNVNFQTSDTAVTMFDGTTLQNWAGSIERAAVLERLKLFAHTNLQHLTAEEISHLLVNLEYDENTGKLKFTSYDGKTSELNTALNKIAVNFTMRKGAEDNETEKGKVFLVLTLEDDSTMEVDVTSLVDIYEGSDGNMIVVSVNGNKEISATLVDKSIPLTKLEQAVQEKILETYTLPAATADALGGVKTSETISIDESGAVHADVAFFNDARVQLALTSYNTADLINLQAAIKNGTSLELEDGTIGIECIVKHTLSGNACFKNGGSTNLYVRKVDASTVNAFTKINLATDAVGNITPVSSDEQEYVVNLAERNFAVEKGATYEVYVSHSMNVADTDTEGTAYVTKTAISQHKFFTHTGDTTTP